MCDNYPHEFTWSFMYNRGVAPSMYDTILVPTDGSETSARAGREAFRLARELGSTVHVLFVIDESASSFLLSGDTMSEVLDELRLRGKDALDVTAAEADSVDVVTEMVRGVKVADAITDYADAHDVDLVVMGTRGRHGVDHLLGSTTERVLARIDRPTLVVGDGS